MHTRAYINTPKAIAWTPWRAEVNEVPAGADQAAPPNLAPKTQPDLPCSPITKIDSSPPKYIFV